MNGGFLCIATINRRILHTATPVSTLFLQCSIILNFTFLRPYAALEKVGIQAQVVNAQQVKKVPGRKTDTGDAEWLAMLARAGLLRGSFIPPERLRTLRQVSRHHQKLTAMQAMEKNRLVKVLSDAGIRLTAVVSDPHGVAASAIIHCLLTGGTPEQALTFAGRLRAPREDLISRAAG